jgi:hypothetical protein
MTKREECPENSADGKKRSGISIENYGNRNAFVII